MKLYANHKETLVQLAQRAIKNRDVNTFSVEVFFGNGSYVLKQEDTLTEVLKALKLLELQARLLLLTK
jgi:hypothetical protein